MQPQRVLTARNLLLLGASFGLFCGIALRNPVVGYLGILALGALAASYQSARKTLADLDVERRHHPRAFEGQWLEVELRVRGRDAQVPSLLLVEDSFTPGDSRRVRHLVLSPIGEGEQAALSYAGQCVHRRGVYNIGPVVARHSDGLGVFENVLTVPVMTPLTVYPSPAGLRVLDILGEGTLAHVGMETTRRIGVSEEFVSTRHYIPGDDPRRIHWRGTARTGELRTKEFQEEITTEVTLFLDASRRGLTGLGDQTSFEYAVKAAASIAQRAVARGHRVALLALGGVSLTLPHGAGLNHLTLLLDNLATVKAEGEGSASRELLANVGELRRGGTFFLIQSATALDLETLRHLKFLCDRRRLRPVVTLIDDRQFVKLHQDQDRQHATALPLAEMVLALRTLGVECLVLQKHQVPQEGVQTGLDRPIDEALGAGRGWGR